MFNNNTQKYELFYKYYPAPTFLFRETRSRRRIVAVLTAVILLFSRIRSLVYEIKELVEFGSDYDFRAAVALAAEVGAVV